MEVKFCKYRVLIYWIDMAVVLTITVFLIMYEAGADS